MLANPSDCGTHLVGQSREKGYCLGHRPPTTARHLASPSTAYEQIQMDSRLELVEYYTPESVQRQLIAGPGQASTQAAPAC